MGSELNSNASKTKAQLISEVGALRQRVTELEPAERDHAQTAAVLNAPEERYRALFEHANDSIFIIDFATHRLLDVNENAARRLGYSKEELLQMTVDDLYPSDEHTLNQMFIERLKDADSIVFERTHVRKDGTTMPVEISSRIIESGGRRVMQSFVRDVTERKQAEERLQRLHISKTLYRDLYEQAPDGYHTLDPNGVFLEINQTALDWVGYSRNDVVGKMRFCELLTPAVVSKYENAVKTLQREGTIALFELEMVRRNGDVFPVRINAKALTDTAGSFMGCRMTIRDITELKWLEAQVRQVQKMEAMGTLASGIAHDFNNILCAMLGYTELVLATLPEESHAWRNLKEVSAGGQRAKDLVQQILTFSRQGEQVFKPVCLSHIISEVLKLLRASLSPTIEIRQHVTTDVAVLADSTQMHQVLMNLCTNSGHAMRETGGVLELRLDECEVSLDDAQRYVGLTPGPYVKLQVRDTGYGMNSYVKERIFDPFFTTKGVDEGTGMGLSVVHGIVAGHGGVITVESEPGLGATFEIYLPRIVLADDVKPPRETPIVAGGCQPSS